MVRCYYTTIRRLKSITLTTSNAGEVVKQKEVSFIAGEYKMVQPLGKTSGSFLQNYAYSY